MMTSQRLRESESKHPREMDDEEDLPENVKEELPEGAEQMFYKALKKAYEDNPEENPGAWYAQAWEELKKEYKNTTPGDEEDDPGADWEKKDESRSADSDINERVQRFMEQ